MFPWVWGWQFVTFCGVNADKITGTSRQILFEGLPPQTQDLHGFFMRQMAASRRELKQRWKNDDFIATLTLPKNDIPQQTQLQNVDLRGVPKLGLDDPLGWFKFHEVESHGIDFSFGDGALIAHNSHIADLICVNSNSIAPAPSANQHSFVLILPDPACGSMRSIANSSNASSTPRPLRADSTNTDFDVARFAIAHFRLQIGNGHTCVLASSRAANLRI